MTEAQEPRPTLRDSGQVYVTARAAQQYAESAAQVYLEGIRLQPEEARRELTELLLGASRVAGDTETPERWRYRSNRLGVDLSARIVRETSRLGHPMLVVVGISARTISRR